MTEERPRGVFRVNKADNIIGILSDLIPECALDPLLDVMTLDGRFLFTVLWIDANNGPCLQLENIDPDYAKKIHNFLNPEELSPGVFRYPIPMLFPD